jgi:hypothetical protein
MWATGRVFVIFEVRCSSLTVKQYGVSENGRGARSVGPVLDNYTGLPNVMTATVTILTPPPSPGVRPGEGSPSCPVLVS